MQSQGKTENFEQYDVKMTNVIIINAWKLYRNQNESDLEENYNFL